MKNKERISVKRHEVDFFANQGFVVNHQPNRLGNYDAYRVIKKTADRQYRLSGSTLRINKSNIITGYSCANFSAREGGKKWTIN